MEKNSGAFNEELSRERRISPIPPHLSQKERKVWEAQLRWELSERERRRKAGYYSSEEGLGAAGSKNKKMKKKTGI